MGELRVTRTQDQIVLDVSPSLAFSVALISTSVRTPNPFYASASRVCLTASSNEVCRVVDNAIPMIESFFSCSLPTYASARNSFPAPTRLTGPRQHGTAHLSEPAIDVRNHLAQRTMLRIEVVEYVVMVMLDHAQIYPRGYKPDRFASGRPLRRAPRCRTVLMGAAPPHRFVPRKRVGVAPAAQRARGRAPTPSSRVRLVGRPFRQFVAPVTCRA